MSHLTGELGMAKHDDLTGLKFGNLTVTKYKGTNHRRQALWETLCTCGNTSISLANKLKSGRTQSCGCLAANRSPDMIGQRFGRLVVREYIGIGPSRAKRYLCDCDCGSTAETSGAKLRYGHTKSCGCLSVDQASKLNVTHGLSSIPEYDVWAGMIQRTTNPNHTRFKNYGGRGIRVCDWWRSFENFLADMGVRPMGKFSIERIDNDGDYEPTNCTWADYMEQSRNKRPRKDRK